MKNLELRIGVFFGSRSPEHDISIITGQLVIAGLKKLNYPVIPVYLDKAGRWMIGEELGSLKYFTEPSTGSGSKNLEYYLDLEKSQGQLIFRQKGLLGGEIIIDIAFPAFHGANGEDGTMQGLFEIFNVPYVGCDVTSSAVTMDKIITKQLFVQQNTPTPKFLYFDKQQWQSNQSEIIHKIEREVKFPAFVKPARLGSSIAIVRANNTDELERAVEVALHYGERCLIEECIENLMDLTVAVLGNDSPTASLIQESVFGDGLFSYDDKYLNDGGAQLGKAQKNLVIPARLDDKTTSEIRSMAINVFKALGCSGIARVDFLHNKETKKYYVTEVNTLPGTLYHHLWQKSGIELGDLLKRLVELAIERHEQKKQSISTFESDILKQARGIKLKKDSAV